MTRPFLRLLFFLAAVLASAPGVSAQSGNLSWAQRKGEIPGGHRGEVTALICDERGRLLSAGADGFLNMWDRKGNAASERFQLSPYGITAMVLRPGKSEVAVIESDGLGLYRISAWDYESMKNLFTLRFRDPVTYINYSAAGNFLIAARSGRTGAAFIHPETGEVLKSPEGLAGSVTFAATGRSERTMISYMSTGILSYWDLESGEEIRRFMTPPNIASPVLIGNNRFFAGFDAGGLVVLDAVSGTVILRDSSIPQGTLISGNPEASEFLCISGQTDRFVLYHLNVNNSGRLETKNRRQVPPTLPPISAGAIVSEDTAALGTADGGVLMFNRNGSARLMSARNQERITEAAVSSQTLAFLSEGSKLGFLPLDYTLIDSGDTLRLGGASPYTAIASDPAADSGFLLWQPENTRSFPVIKTLSGSPQSGNTQDAFIDKVTFRFPPRAVSVLENRCLFLDSVGNIAVTDQEAGELLFTFSAPGSQDAAFIDEANIIIGRSAGTGNTPFLMVNILTGETVPLPLPGTVGSDVYRGSSGAIYGGLVNRDGNSFKTSVIVINLSNPSQSQILVDYAGEDTQFAMAETEGSLASSLGGGGALLYHVSGRAEAHSLERNSGLPRRLLNGGRWFIQLDTEGSISWHDPRTGKILAVFRLYGGEWVLDREGRTIRGKVIG
jgi:outer membrane protein assembly factor BamB